jgi:YYY domain-containing protein
MKYVLRISILLAILVVAAVLRFTGLDWDQGTHLHPDERYVTFLASILKIPQTWSLYFDAGQSPLNPYNTEWGRSYVYGTLPLFIVRYLAEWLDSLCSDTGAWVANLLLAIWLSTDAPICKMGEFTSYNTIVLVGRAWSALVDWFSVLVLFYASRRIFGWRVGLFSAAFYAIAVLPIQQAHFFTVDSTANMFVMLCLAACVGLIFSTRARFASVRMWVYALFAGVFAGAAIASKISTWPLVPMILLSVGVALARDRHRTYVSLIIAFVATLLAGIAIFGVFRVGQPYAFVGNSTAEAIATMGYCAKLPAVNSFANLCKLALDLPSPVRDVVTPSSRWIEQLTLAQGFVDGTIDAPFGIQWANRTRYIFPLVNIVFWGLGMPLGIAAILGVAIALRRLFHGRRWWVYVPMLAWVCLFFAYQGGQWTKAMRYQLPIYPFLCIFAAMALVTIGDQMLRGWRADGKWMMRALPAMLVTLLTVFWAFGFNTIYRNTYSRVQATRWIYENVPAGSVIANEHWDDAMPVVVNRKNVGVLRRDPQEFGKITSSPQNPNGEIRMYDEDTPEKLNDVIKWLNETDYLVLSSNRLYASIPRLPMRYPLANEYYRALFSGELGFELVADFNQFLQIGPFVFNDQEMPFELRRLGSTQGTVPWWQVPYPTAEEAFSVYDHPRVLIFKKGANYSQVLAESVLGKIDLTQVHVQAPITAQNAPNGLRMTKVLEKAQQSGGTWSSLFPDDALLNQSQALAVVAWLVMIEALGIAAWPLLGIALRSAKTGLGVIPDRGYAFAKIFGLLLLALFVWWLSSTKITAFTRTQIGVCFAFMLMFSAYYWWRHGGVLLHELKSAWQYAVIAEVIFAVVCACFLLIRIGNPDLWHPYMGGEKPMDFAYFNAVLKSSYFPPYDPWNAGGYLNYYYFGWVIFGAPVKLLGIDPTLAYNIILPTIAALVASGTFSLGTTIMRHIELAVANEPVARDGSDETTLVTASTQALAPARLFWLGHIRSICAGVLAALMVVMLGNIEQIWVLGRAWQRLGGIESGVSAFTALINGFQIWWQGQALPIHPLQLYWDATRLFDHPGTFAEFPFFTFLYADLHAHMMSMPLVILVLGCALAFVCGAINWRNVVFAAMTVGALWSSNSWDYPTMLMVCGAAIGIGLLGDDRAWFYRLRDGIIAIVSLFLLSRLFYVPYLENYGAAYNSIKTWSGDNTPLSVYFKIYLLFLLPIVFLLVLDLSATLQNTLPVTAPRRVSTFRNNVFSPAWLPTSEQRIARSRALAAVILVVISLFASILMAYFGVVSALASLPLTVITALAVLVKNRAPIMRFHWFMIAVGFALTLFVELFALQGDIGRMNTVFKFYVQAWLLLGIGAAVAIVWAIWRLRWFSRIILISGLSLLMPLALLYPATAAPAKMHDRYTTNAPTGLDGDEYMRFAQYSERIYNSSTEFPLVYDYEAIQWMRKHVVGSPIIMEGTTGGALYRWGNRFSIYTGLPTVIGWQWHQRQQRAVLPDRLVVDRDHDVSDFYNTTDVGYALKLLRRYNVRYVIVGRLEHSYYEKEGLKKFDLLVKSGFLRVMFQNAGTTVYEVS